MRSLPRTKSAVARHRAARVLHQHVTQGHVAAIRGLVADGVWLAQGFGLDDDVSYSCYKELPFSKRSPYPPISFSPNADRRPLKADS